MNPTDIPDRNALRPCNPSWVICLLAAVLLMLAAPVASAVAQTRHQHPKACANAVRRATGASVATMDVAVVCLINQQRVERGLAALTVSSRLTSSAQRWNDAMVASGYLTHGSNFAERISAVGYNWQTAGENIASGYPTPTRVVAAWMASTGDCQNILDPSFRNVGTGETPSPVGRSASGPATWTQDFGLLMSQSAPSSNHGPQDGCPYK